MQQLQPLSRLYEGSSVADEQVEQARESLQQSMQQLQQSMQQLQPLSRLY
jgi:hypothetical protein